MAAYQHGTDATDKNLQHSSKQSSTRKWHVVFQAGSYYDIQTLISVGCNQLHPYTSTGHHFKLIWDSSEHHFDILGTHFGGHGLPKAAEKGRSLIFADFEDLGSLGMGIGFNTFANIITKTHPKVAKKLNPEQMRPKGHGSGFWPECRSELMRMNAGACPRDPFDCHMGPSQMYGGAII